MVTAKLTTDYYVYNLIDADGVVRYVGKGTGRRIYNHFSMAEAIAAGILVTRASNAHRRFAAEIRIDGPCPPYGRGQWDGNA